MPELTAIALGLTLGLIALVAAASLRPIHRAWVLPALVATVLVVAPSSLDTAIDSWGISTLEGILAVAAATLTAGAAGALAVIRLGERSLLLALAGMAVAMFTGVPDTERTVVMALALVVFLLAPRLVPELPVPVPAAAVGAAGVVLVGLDGATAGTDGAVGAWGTVIVLLASVGARRVPSQLLPAGAVLPAALAVAAVVVARLTASDLATRPLALAIVAVVAVTALVVRILGDRLPPDDPPAPQPDDLTSEPEPLLP